MILPVCPSKVRSGLGFVDLISYSFTVWWPAAARYLLSGEIHRRLTWESGCWIVREHIPDKASQNLHCAELASGVKEVALPWVCEPDRVVVTRCCTLLALKFATTGRGGGGWDRPVHRITDMVADIKTIRALGRQMRYYVVVK